MFLKQANSDMENGIKKIKMSPAKYSRTVETGKDTF